jgi:hypothetical protein
LDVRDWLVGRHRVGGIQVGVVLHRKPDAAVLPFAALRVVQPNPHRPAADGGHRADLPVADPLVGERLREPDSIAHREGPVLLFEHADAVQALRVMVTVRPPATTVTESAFASTLVTVA